MKASKAVNSEGTFIAGCHRSGTTLLSYLLDTHPLLACPPESKFIFGLHTFIHDPQVAKGLASLGLTDRHVRRLLRRMVDDTLMSYARKQRKPRWIDKTPNHARILPFIDELFERHARYIVLVRHPFDCILSLHEYFQKATIFDEDPTIRFVVQHYGNTPYGWAKYWRDANEELYYFATRARSRCHIVKYENLARFPEKCVGETLDFLAIGRVRGDASKMCARALRVPHTHGYQDKKIRSTRRIHEESIGKWSGWTMQRRRAYWFIVGTVATAFGYSIIDAS